MDTGPLVNEEIDAGAEFVRAFNHVVPVKVAFWLKASDDEQRYLYISSDRIDAGDLGMAYREVGRLVRGMQSPWLDPFRIKLISGDDALAVVANNIQQRFHAPLPTRIGGGRFADITIDDVYIYPACLPATVP